MAGRAIVSFIFLFFTVLIMKKPLFAYFREWKRQLILIFSSIMIAYMWYTIAACEKVLTASMASFLLTSLVIVSWIIAVFFIKDRKFYYVNLIGIILAVVGVLTILGYQNIFYGNKNIWYSLLYISGIAAFLIGVAVNKKCYPGMDPFIATTINLFYTAIILLLASLIFEAPFSHTYSTASLLSVVGVGLISTGIGYLIFFWLVMHAGQLFASYNGYLVPVFGFLMGTFFLGEPYHWHQLLGLGIVFVGMALTNVVDLKKLN